MLTEGVFFAFAIPIIGRVSQVGFITAKFVWSKLSIGTTSQRVSKEI
jgi:hypothetical protein